MFHRHRWIYRRRRTFGRRNGPGAHDGAAPVYDMVIYGDQANTGENLFAETASVETAPSDMAQDPAPAATASKETGATQPMFFNAAFSTFATDAASNVVSVCVPAGVLKKSRGVDALHCREKTPPVVDADTTTDL